MTGIAGETANFSGTLTGCGGAGVTGITITLSTGGSVVSTSGGAFSGSVAFVGSSVSVTFSTAASFDYVAYSHTFTLYPGTNTTNIALTVATPAAPTINSISNVTLCGTSGTVSLAGITDGNSGAATPIHVVATSSNTAIIPNPSVTYTSPNTTGTLNYTVSSAGTATITVHVSNTGYCSTSASTNTTFTIAARVPSSPTVNNPGNFGYGGVGGLETVTVSGIGPGAGNSAAKPIAVGHQLQQYAVPVVGVDLYQPQHHGHVQGQCPGRWTQHRLDHDHVHRHR